MTPKEKAINLLKSRKYEITKMVILEQETRIA